MSTGRITAKHKPADKERDTRRTAALRAQRVFAPSLNAVTWALMQKPDRTEHESEKMLYAAFASAFHYLEVGNPEHHQRAEWLLSRVYVVLGNAAEALRHALRCLELTGKYNDHLDDYDVAFAYEAMSRASALAGNMEDARSYHTMAANAGMEIEDLGHRRVFEEEFKNGNWNGLL